MLCNFIIFIKWLLGLLCLGFGSYGTYYIVNKQKDLSCSNFDTAFIFGLISYVLLFIGIVFNFIICNFRPILAVGTLCLCGTLGYSSYMYFTISSECKELQKNTSSYSAFQYYLLSLVITFSLLVVYYFTRFIMNRRKRQIGNEF